MLASRHALGIDIGDDACRLVGLRRAGHGYVLTALACLPLDGITALEDSADAVRALVRDAGGGRVASALAASGCAFKTASLPPAKAAELAQVMRFEAENQFPLPLHEIEWGYTLALEPSGRRHAVIAGARRSLVEERLAQLRACDVTPAALLPAPMAAARAVRPLDGPHLVILAGAAWSDLCLYQGDRLLGCRSVKAGPPSVRGWGDRIAREVRPWIAGHDEISTALLLGVVDQTTATTLAQATDLHVLVGDPWHGIQDPSGCRDGLDDPLPAYATAIGLAQSALAGVTTLNLLPRPLLDARRGQRKLLWATAVLVCALAALIPPTIHGIGQADRSRRTLRDVTAELSAVRRQTVAPPASGLLQAEKVLTTLRQPASQPLEMLGMISVHLPEKIKVTDLTFVRGKSVVLKGRAASNEVLAKSMSVINRMPCFEHATLDYSNRATDVLDPGYDFQITCGLSAGADPTLETGKRAGSARKGVSSR